MVVCRNDAAWDRSGSTNTALRAEKSPATQLAPTRYDKVVEALGGYGEHVTQPAQIRRRWNARWHRDGRVRERHPRPEAPAASGAQGYAI